MNENRLQWENKDKPASKEDIIRECSQPDRRNYCSFLMRPGFWAWSVELEYTKFKPDTDANDDFHLMVSMFPEKDPIPQLIIGVVSIDKSGQEFAESILWKHGLRKCDPGLTIKCLGPGGEEDFFLYGPNIFVLENHSKGAINVVYTNDPVKMMAAFAHEQQQVQRFFDEHKAWIKTPEGRAIADAYWKRHPSGRVY